jgi:hypothetical protein
VVHSIELLLDDRTEHLVRKQWRLLDEAGLPSAGRLRGSSPPARPHVTLIACTRIETDQLAPIGDLMRKALPMELVLGAPMIFGRTGTQRPGLIVVRQVLASTALLELQQQVAAVCPPAVDQHFDPGRWAPHVTFGHRYSPEQIGVAVSVLGTAEINARASGCRYWQGDLRQATALV